MFVSSFLKMTIEEGMGDVKEYPSLQNGADDNEVDDISSEDVAANSHVTANVEDLNAVSPENGDMAQETDPLSGGACADVSEDFDHPPASKMSMEDLEEGDSSSRRKSFDRKCIVLGVLLLLVIVAGAIGAVFINKFSTKITYSFRLDRFFADHMMLQRAPHRAAIFGTGPVESGKNVTVRLVLEWPNKTQVEYQALVEPTVSGGKWRVLLHPVAESGPVTITAKLDKPNIQAIQIKDVIFGDIWLCAGQKNMQHSLNDMMEAMSSEDKEAILDDLNNSPDMRLLGLWPMKSFNFAESIEEPYLRWTSPSVEDARSQQRNALHFSALCWLYGRRLHRSLGHPIGLITSTYYSSSIEDWIPPDVVKTCNISVPYETSTVYKMMIKPLHEIVIYGAIWYQGENDAEATVTPMHYSCSLVNMIKSWRLSWYTESNAATDLEFPFGIVQLSAYSNGTNETWGYQDIRWQQTANYGYVPNPAMPNTFMAVTLDLLDSTNRESPREKEIAERLYLGAVRVGYKQQARYQGPQPDKYAAFRGNSSLVLVYDETLEHRHGQGFEVCCAETSDKICSMWGLKVVYAPGREWVSARIVRTSAQAVTLSLGEACSDKAVTGWRYLWYEAPCRDGACPLYGAQSGLPVAPFIKQGLVQDGRYHDVDRSPTAQLIA